MFMGIRNERASVNTGSRNMGFQGCRRGSMSAARHARLDSIGVHYKNRRERMCGDTLKLGIEYSQYECIINVMNRQCHSSGRVIAYGRSRHPRVHVQILQQNYQTLHVFHPLNVLILSYQA